MNFYLHIHLLIIVLCYIYEHTSVEIKLELQKKNILKCGYGINYKYEGMLAHSFDRFLCSDKIYFANNG